MKTLCYVMTLLVAFNAAAETLHTDSYFLGIRIQEGIRKGDLSALEKAFDTDALTSRTLGPLKLPDAAKDYLARAMQSRTTSKAVAEAFAGNGKNLAFVGVRRMLEEYCLLFRSVADHDEIGYCGCVIGEAGGGRVTLIDVYSCAPAEMLSDTIRRQCLVLLAKGETNLLEGLDARHKDLIMAQSELTRFSSACESGDNATATEIYAKLPASLRTEKFVMFDRTRVALHAGEADFLAAIRPWRETYPDDPALEMFVSNYYWLKNDNQKAIKSFERLNELLGGDAKLDLRMARLDLESGLQRSAKIRLWQAVHRDPPDAASFVALLQTTLSEGSYEETAQALSLQETTFGVDLKDKVKAEPSYEAFRRSAAYQAWLKGPPVADPGATTQVAANPDALTLQGVMFVPSRPSALISGKTVFVGDKVKGYKVVKIEPQSVTLQSAAGEIRVLSSKGS